MVEIIVRVVDAKLFGPMPAAASFNAEVAFSRPEQVLKQSEGGCKLWHSDKMRSVEKNHGNFIKLLEINSMTKCYTATVPLWNRRVLSEDLS